MHISIRKLFLEIISTYKATNYRLLFTRNENNSINELIFTPFVSCVVLCYGRVCYSNLFLENKWRMIFITTFFFTNLVLQLVEFPYN